MVNRAFKGFLLLAIAAFMLQGHNAYAATATPEGAARLKARFEKEFSTRKNIKAAGMDASYTGAVSVTPKDSYYEVTFPSLSLKDKQGNVFKVGKIAMNMSPFADSETEWKASLALPATMKYLDKKGTQTNEVVIANQKASGFWNMDMFGFRQMSATYGDVRIRTLSTTEETTAKNINIAYDFIKNEKNYNGPVNVDITDINYKDADGKISSVANSLKTVTTVTADKSAANGFIQTTEADIDGLGNALSLLAIKMRDPNVTNKAALQKTFGVLTILQMSGKPASGNQDTRHFTVQTDTQGRTLLNGVDVSILLNGSIK